MTKCKFCGTEQRPLGTTSGITFCYAETCIDKTLAHIREVENKFDKGQREWGQMAQRHIGET